MQLKKSSKATLQFDDSFCPPQHCLTKIISGGQNGVDYAGLVAAKEQGFETGGWAPLNFKTKIGSRPILASEYNLVDSGKNYKTRTYWNVRDSDGTLHILSNINSFGTICTNNAIVKFSKPEFRILVPFKKETLLEQIAAEACNWILEHNIIILNISGNSDKTKPDGQNFLLAHSIIKHILERYKNNVYKNSESKEGH